MIKVADGLEKILKIPMIVVSGCLLLSVSLVLMSCLGDDSSSSGSSAELEDDIDDGSSSPSIPLPDANYINLPVDANGWTIFSPSADTDVVYISESGDDNTCQSYRVTDVEMGSNPFTPDGAVLPCATYLKAYSLTSDDSPDWILFKRGEVFVDHIALGDIHNGRSETEPFLVAAYGAAGAVPVIKIGANIGIDMRYGATFVAYSSLELYAHTANPDDLDFVAYTGRTAFDGTLSAGASIKGILLEGCKFRFSTGGIFQKYLGTECGSITIRRCLFEKSYSTLGHSSGFGASEVDNLIIEENIFYHNGWLIQNALGDQGDKSDGQAVYFNHNMYHTRIRNALINNNLIIEGASGGLKITSNGVARTENVTVHNNLFLGGTVGVNIGNNYNDVTGRFKNIAITDNVFTSIGWSRPTLEETAWGTYLDGWDGGQLTGNLFINFTNPANLNTKGIAFESNFSDFTVSDNVVYNLINGTGFDIRTDGTPVTVSNTSVNNNILEMPDTYSYIANLFYENTGRITFGDNKYYSANTDNSFVYTTTIMNFDVWQSSTGDNSTIELVSFVDNTRSIETFNASVGGAATIDAFIATAISQDRYNWLPDYEAAQVVNWLKAGFVVVP